MYRVSVYGKDIDNVVPLKQVRLVSFIWSECSPPLTGVVRRRGWGHFHIYDCLQCNSEARMMRGFSGLPIAQKLESCKQKTFTPGD